VPDGVFAQDPVQRLDQESGVVPREGEGRLDLEDVPERTVGADEDPFLAHTLGDIGSFLEPDGRVGYRYGQSVRDQETMDYLELIARVTSHIPDKGRVTVRYCGLYANAHRGKVKKASLEVFPLRIVGEELPRIPSKGRAAMSRKVYEVNPMVCPRCGGAMRVVAFLTEHAAVARIIDHLKLTFVAERPPPPHAAFQELLMDADPSVDYFP
jgi:hypothetical protein